MGRHGVPPTPDQRVCTVAGHGRRSGHQRMVWPLVHLDASVDVCCGRISLPNRRGDDPAVGPAWPFAATLRVGCPRAAPARLLRHCTACRPLAGSTGRCRDARTGLARPWRRVQSSPGFGCDRQRSQRRRTRRGSAAGRCVRRVLGSVDATQVAPICCHLAASAGAARGVPACGDSPRSSGGWCRSRRWPYPDKRHQDDVCTIRPVGPAAACGHTPNTLGRQGYHLSMCHRSQCSQALCSRSCCRKCGRGRRVPTAPSPVATTRRGLVIVVIHPVRISRPRFGCASAQG